MPQMDLPRVKNSLNAHLFPRDYEENDLPSLTVPDQSMTVRQIMERYAAGLPLGGARVPLWETDEEGSEDYIPDPSHLDLAERQELEERYAEEINAIEQKKIRYEAWKKAKEAEKDASEQEAKNKKDPGSDNTMSEQKSEAK